MNRQKVLIKYGGNAMSSTGLTHEIAAKIKELRDHQIQVVLVHGGGPFINRALEKAGIASEFFDGQRYTSSEALQHIEKTLKGEVNSSLVNVLNQAGLKAVGLSGRDGQIVRAKKRWHRTLGTSGEPISVDLGQVGEVEQVDTQLLQLLLEAGYTPVITCIASDKNGNGYNINGDSFAGKIAASLRVDDYIVLTDVDGLYKKYPDPNSIISDVALGDLPSYYGSVITGGMMPKIESCEDALRSGVNRAVILNGTKPQQIEDYILKNKKIGTTLTK